MPAGLIRMGQKRSVRAQDPWEHISMPDTKSYLIWCLSRKDGVVCIWQLDLDSFPGGVGGHQKRHRFFAAVQASWETALSRQLVGGAAGRGQKSCQPVNNAGEKHWGSSPNVLGLKLLFWFYQHVSTIKNRWHNALSAANSAQKATLHFYYLPKYTRPSVPEYSSTISLSSFWELTLFGTKIRLLEKNNQTWMSAQCYSNNICVDTSPSFTSPEYHLHLPMQTSC